MGKIESVRNGGIKRVKIASKIGSDSNENVLSVLLTIRFFLVRRVVVVGLGAHDRSISISCFLDGDGDRVGLIHRFSFRSILSTSSILLHVRDVERGISDLRCTRNGLRGSHVECCFEKGVVG